MSNAIDFLFRARVEEFEKRLGELPNLTKTEARKITKQWAAEQQQWLKDQRKNARESEKAWDKATDGILSRLESIVPGFGGASSAAKDFGGVVGGLAAPLGVAAAAGGLLVAVLASATANATELGIAVDQVGIKSGLSTRNVVALQGAAKAAGVDFGQLEGAAETLADRLGDAVLFGSADARESFDLLGVSVTDATGAMRSADEVLPEVVDKMLALEDATARAKLQQELFGGGGAELLRTLSDGTATLDRWRDRTDGLAAALDRMEGSAAANREASAKLDAQWDELSANIATVTLPAMTGVLEVLNSTADSWERFSVTVATNNPLLGLAADAASAAAEIWGTHDALQAVGVDAFVGPRMPSAGPDTFVGPFEELPVVGPSLADGGPARGGSARGGSSVRAASTPAGPVGDNGGIAGLVQIDQLVAATAELYAQNVELQDLYADLYAVELEGADAINAAYDERLAKLMELQEFALDDQAFKDAIAENDKQRIDELAAYEANAREESAAARKAEASARLDDATQWLAVTGATVRAISQLQTAASDIAISNMEEGSEEREKAARRAWKISKGLAVVQAGINTAVGVTAGLASPYPFNIALPVVAAVAGAAEIATIAASKPPTFHIGGAVDERVITAQTGEGVVSRQGMDAIGGPGGLDEINRGRSPSSGDAMPVVVVNVDGRALEGGVTTALDQPSAETRGLVERASRRPGHRRAA